MDQLRKAISSDDINYLKYLFEKNNFSAEEIQFIFNYYIQELSNEFITFLINHGADIYKVCMPMNDVDIYGKLYNDTKIKRYEFTTANMFKYKINEAIDRVIKCSNVDLIIKLFKDNINEEYKVHIRNRIFTKLGSSLVNETDSKKLLDFVNTFYNSDNKVKSNFEKVRDEFNIEFGLENNPHHNFPTDAITKLKLDLIKEEVKELEQAIIENDYIEVIDAIADILYVTYGAATAFGFNADKAFDIVHRSNMSKLCDSEENAIETVEWYKKCDTRYDSPTYRLSNDKIHYTVYNFSTGKVLKNIKYTSANFVDDEKCYLV
jgi:hypothetical protein